MRLIIKSKKGDRLLFEAIKNEMGRGLYYFKFMQKNNYIPL